MSRVLAFFKKEAVLTIAALCAVVTMFFVPPDSAYIAYIDLRVLCLLLCLMAVVAGFQSCGAFRCLALWLLRRTHNGRILSLILVLLPFFCAMLVTNDVALLTFVPFTVMLLRQIGCHRAIIPLLVMQTIAANLGSMATPVGNPQNLYLYAFYELGAGEFFRAVLPATALSLVCLAAVSVLLLPEKLPDVHLPNEHIRHPRRLALYAVLFVLCLMTVFRLVHYGVMTAIVVVAVFLLERKILKELDYPLLLTFVCFFILSGNLGRLEAVHNLLTNFLQRSTLLTSLCASQVISNVPAAVLLSEFTTQWRELLLGVNIGGLGTPVASLASLITLKLYLREHDAHPLHFLLLFTIANVAGIVILLTFC